MAYTASETWDLSEGFPFSVGVLRRGVRTPVNGGMVQRRQTQSSEGSHGQAAVRTFTVTFANATKADYNRCVELWKKTNGGAEGINYTLRTPYTGSTEAVIVRMVAAPMMASQRSAATGGLFSFYIALEEMLHAP